MQGDRCVGADALVGLFRTPTAMGNPTAPAVVRLCLRACPNGRKSPMVKPKSHGIIIRSHRGHRFRPSAGTSTSARARDQRRPGSKLTGAPASTPIRGRFAVIAYLADAALRASRRWPLPHCFGYRAAAASSAGCKGARRKDGHWYTGNPGLCHGFEGVARQNSGGALVIVRGCTRHPWKATLVGMMPAAADVLSRPLRAAHLDGMAGRVTRDTRAAKASAVLPPVASEERP
jgi:hypothetical protein